MILPQELLDEISLYLPFESAIVITNNAKIINKKYKPHYHTVNWAIFNDYLHVLTWIGDENETELFELLKRKLFELLKRCVDYRSKKCMGYLLRKNNLKCLKDYEHYHLLHTCINSGNMELLKELMVLGPDLSDYSFLVSAVGNIQMFEYCKKLGFKEEKDEIMKRAIKNVDLRFVKYLYNQGYEFCGNERGLFLKDYDMKIFDFLFLNYDNARIHKSDKSYCLNDHYKKYTKIYGEENILYDDNTSYNDSN